MFKLRWRTGSPPSADGTELPVPVIRLAPPATTPSHPRVVQDGKLHSHTVSGRVSSTDRLLMYFVFTLRNGLERGCSFMPRQYVRLCCIRIQS